MKTFLPTLILPLLSIALMGTAKEMPYNESADAEADIAAAIATAAQSDRKVMLVFGANWCPDCRALSKAFKQDAKLSKLIDKNFVVAKINIGRWDANTDIAKRYEEAASNGIPSVAVLNAEGELISVTKARELASAFKMSGREIRQWFVNLVKRLN